MCIEEDQKREKEGEREKERERGSSRVKSLNFDFVLYKLYLFLYFDI